MSRTTEKRLSPYLKHWIVDAILLSSHTTKANTVKVIKHISGPNPDGSITREVTDGNVFIKAVFLAEALEEMFGDEYSSQPPEWYSALLILKKYTVCFDAKNCLEQSEFIIKVTSASVWDLQQGFYLKFGVTDCMDNLEVRDLAKEAYENNIQVQNRSFSMDCSIPLTQLLENMTNTDSQEEKSSDEVDLKKHLSVEEFIISPEEHEILESIQEWKSDYVPAFEDFSQTSPMKTSNESQKDNEGSKSYQNEFIKYFKRSMKTPEIISSGESIKLSCSDHSGDENDNLSQGHHDKVIVTSSSEESNAQESSRKGDNSDPKCQNIDKDKCDDSKSVSTRNLLVSDGSVSSTVNIQETQAFSPTFSPTQGFDPFLSPQSRKSSHSSSVSQSKDGEMSTSDLSLIGDTPEDDKIKNVKLGSHRKPSELEKSKLDKSVSENAEDCRLKSLQKQSNQSEQDREEDDRLIKLTSSTEPDSAEQLLRQLDKPSSVEAADQNMISSQESGSSSQKHVSISDSTLMEISSGQMRTVSPSPPVVNNDQIIAAPACDLEMDVETQDPDGFVNNTSSKRSRADSDDQPQPASKVRKVVGDVANKNNGTNSCIESSRKLSGTPHKDTLLTSDKVKPQIQRKSSVRLENKRNKLKSISPNSSAQKDQVDMEESQSVLDTSSPVLKLPLLAPEPNDHEKESDNSNKKLPASPTKSTKIGQIIPSEKAGSRKTPIYVARKLEVEKDAVNKTFTQADTHDKGEVDVIIISSGEAEEHLQPKTVNRSKDLHEKQSSSDEVLENRQRNPCTQSDFTSQGKSSDHSTTPELIFDHSTTTDRTLDHSTTPDKALDHSTSKAPITGPGPSTSHADIKTQQRSSKSSKSQPKISLLDQFLNEVQPISEIGKRLTSLTIPDDLFMSAITYYKDLG